MTTLTPPRRRGTDRHLACMKTHTILENHDLREKRDIRKKTNNLNIFKKNKIYIYMYFYITFRYPIHSYGIWTQRPETIRIHMESQPWDRKTYEFMESGPKAPKPFGFTWNESLGYRGVRRIIKIERRCSGVPRNYWSCPNTCESFTNDPWMALGTRESGCGESTSELDAGTAGWCKHSWAARNLCLQ